MDDEHWYWRINPKSGNRVTQGALCKKCVLADQAAKRTRKPAREAKPKHTPESRAREYAARRAKRAAAGAKPRPVPDMLKRPAPAPDVPRQSPEEIARITAEGVAAIRKLFGE